MTTRRSRAPSRFIEEPEEEPVVDPIVSSSIVRDERYYFKDGNAIFLVSSVLFNVHRSIISQDDSVFGTMFQIGSESLSLLEDDCAGRSGSDAEGSADHKPIALEGIPLDGFRDLLWALYALPPSIIAESRPHIRLEQTRFTSLAHAFHRFEFCNLEQWALSVLRAQVMFKASVKKTGPIIPEDSTEYIHALGDIAEVAVLCEDAALTEGVTKRLEAVLARERIEEVVSLITLSEHLNMRSLKAKAYLSVLKMEKEAHKLLTRRQRLTLAQGHFSLCQEFDEIWDTPTPLPHTECTNIFMPVDGNCLYIWVKAWKRFRPKDLSTIPRWDAMELLGVILRGMKNEAWCSSSQCHYLNSEATHLTEERLRILEESLAERFEIVPY